MSIQALTYVLEHCEATRGPRCIMFAIANHADEHGENCWASVATLAHEARLSRRGAQEALAQLREGGEIEAMGTSRAHTTVYRIVGMAAHPEQVPLLGSREGSAETAHPRKGSAETSTGGAQKSGLGGAGSAPKPSGTVREPEPSLDGSLSGNEPRDVVGAWVREHLPDQPFSFAVPAVWRLHMARRRNGRKVITPQCVRELLRKQGRDAESIERARKATA